MVSANTGEQTDFPAYLEACSTAEAKVVTLSSVRFVLKKTTLPEPNLLEFYRSPISLGEGK